MPLYGTFPDIEAVVAAAIRNENVTGLGPRVYSSVPADPTYPLAVVQRIGGSPAIRQHLDAANIQIDVWGKTKSQARDIAEAARVAVLKLEGTSVTDPVSAFISAVDDSLGLSWVPDPETARDRYVFGLLVYAR